MLTGLLSGTVVISAIILDGNPPVRFHSRMSNAALEKFSSMMVVAYQNFNDGIRVGIVRA